MYCHQSHKIERDQDTCKLFTTFSEQQFSVKLEKVYNTRLAILYDAQIMVTDFDMLNFMSHDKTRVLHTFSSFCCASQDGAAITKSSAYRSIHTDNNNKNILCKKLNILHYVLRTMTQQKLQIWKLLCCNPGTISLALLLYAMFYLKCKIFRTCDFCDRNPLKGFKINSH